MYFRCACACGCALRVSGIWARPINERRQREAGLRGQRPIKTRKEEKEDLEGEEGLGADLLTAWLTGRESDNFSSQWWHFQSSVSSLIFYLKMMHFVGEKRVAQWKIVKGRKIGEGRLSSSQPVEPPPKRGREWGSGVKKWLPRQIQIRGDWVIARGTASEIAKSTRNWGSSAIEIRDAWRKCHREKCGKSWTISR